MLDLYRKRKVWARGLSSGTRMALVTGGTYDGMAGAISPSPFAKLRRFRQDRSLNWPVDRLTCMEGRHEPD